MNANERLDTIEQTLRELVEENRHLKEVIKELYATNKKLYESINRNENRTSLRSAK